MINAFKRWLYRMVKEGGAVPVDSERTNKLHDMLSHNMAAMVAFKIDNGYIVRTMNPEIAYHGERSPGFVYCADHQAIADHLVSAAVKERLGLQEQTAVANKRRMIINPQSTAGLVGSQQATTSY
jgi:hypothetical protein